MGSIVLKPGYYHKETQSLVIREITFKEYCDKHDELCLEYDIDELWDSWNVDGPCFEILRLGKIRVMWKSKFKT